MKQVQLKLLLCLLLATSATGYLTPTDMVSNRYVVPRYDMVRAAPGSIGMVPITNSFGYSGQPTNAQSSNLVDMRSMTPDNSWRTSNQQLTVTSSPQLKLTAQSIAEQDNLAQQLPAVNMNQRANAAGHTSMLISDATAPEKDKLYDLSAFNRLSYGGSDTYNKLSAKLTGSPFGIQSTGEHKYYPPEKLDLSKCGPPPAVNPCTPFGPQLYPLPGSPQCYIQCAFGRLLIKPCPFNLVWNARINVCDWSIVASPTDHNDYGKQSFDNSRSYDRSSTYETANNNYRSALRHSYGRKKRSTTERKKRAYQGYGGQYQGAIMQPIYHQVPISYRAAAMFPPRPLAVPLKSVNLPGPVSFSGLFGLPNLSPSTGHSLSTPQVNAPLGVPAMVQPTSVPAPAPASAPVSAPTSATVSAARGAPMYSSSYGRLYAMPISTAQTTAVVAPSLAASVPAAQSIAPSTMLSSMFSRQAMPSTSSYASSSPVRLSATLIPGPLYPLGPPSGKPFGGRLSPPFPPFGGKSIPRFAAYGGHSMPSATPFSMPFPVSSVPPAVQSAQLFRSLGGYPVSVFRPFPNPPVRPIKLINFQHTPMFGYFGGQSLPQYQPISVPSYGASQDSTQATSGPFGYNFDLHILPADDDSSNNNDLSGGGGEKKKKKSKTSRRDTTTESYLDADDNDYYPKKFDYSKNGNFRSYRGRSKYDENDWNVNNRKKRQYAPYVTRNEQVPIISTTGQKQQNEANYNPIQHSSSYSVQQPSLISNQLLSQSFIESSPCIGKPSKKNVPHPFDSTKYIACLNEVHYKIMNCPVGLIYNSFDDQCQKKKNDEAICEREKPCMNGGQCYQTSPTTYKCTCLSAWTGSRCETPVSSCANNPCGQGNECHTLKVNDYQQDYVCVCDNYQYYGLNCGRNKVPNPCYAAKTEQEQYFPFAFSSQAFVQCNGDVLYVQSCTFGLYWNQEKKVCDLVEAVTASSPQDQSQSYQIVHNGKQQQSPYVHAMANVFNQISTSNRPLVNEAFPSRQRSDFDSFQMTSHHLKNKLTRNSPNFVQDKPILASRSSWSTPLTQADNFNQYSQMQQQYDQSYNQQLPTSRTF